MSERTKEKKIINKYLEFVKNPRFNVNPTQSIAPSHNKKKAILEKMIRKAKKESSKKKTKPLKKSRKYRDKVEGKVKQPDITPNVSLETQLMMAGITGVFVGALAERIQDRKLKKAKELQKQIKKD